jgi:hypothetical protein
MIRRASLAVSERTENSSESMSLNTTSQTTQNPPFPWTGAQMSGSGFSAAQTPQQMKDWILLDSLSPVNLFCNPAFVHNITKGDEKLFLATNAGNLLTITTAIVPGYGKV